MISLLKRLLPNGPVINPLHLILERMGLVEPKLVAFQTFAFMWPETDDEGVTEIYDETSTIYLVEFPSGRRGYRVFEYGYSKQRDAHEIHLAPVMAWIYGGPLPRGYEICRPTEIVQLRVVRGQA